MVFIMYVLKNYIFRNIFVDNGFVGNYIVVMDKMLINGR
jgi:hypothetical protein